MSVWLINACNTCVKLYNMKVIGSSTLAILCVCFSFAPSFAPTEICGFESVSYEECTALAETIMNMAMCTVNRVKSY